MKKLVGAAAAAVVVAMTSVTTWAVAEVIEPGAVRIVVGLKAGADQQAPARAVSRFGTRWAAPSSSGRAQLDELRAKTAEVPSDRRDQAITALRADPNVAYVEVDQQVEAFDVTPNDPQYTAGNQTEFSDVNVPAAWDTTTGSAVTVAVVDSGVTATGDLAGAVLPGYDFYNNDSNAADDAGHGTRVASLIAARGNNGSGMAGVCWSCKILPVKVLNSAGRGYASDIAEGIVYATRNGAKIINLSLGGDWSKVEADAVAYANLKGVLVVAAAGNENSTAPVYPAGYAGVVSVGATASGSDAPAYFTNRNSSTTNWVDVAAPGIVTSMTNRGSYSVAEGTSFAAPIVAGVGALVKTRNPSYTGYSLANALTGKARKIGSWVSAGIVDAPASLTATTDRLAPTVTGASPASGAKTRGTITVKPTGVADTGGSGIRNVDLYAYGKYVSQDTTAPYELKLDTTRQNNGTVALTVYVYDRAGNRGSYNRSIVVDNLAPSVKITSAPANNARVRGTVTVKASASDFYGVNRTELIISGRKVATDKTSPYQFSFAASSQPRSMKVQVRAYDQAGNVKYSSTRNWTR
ncbi:S8 family serine peptidase [Jidongwangia harbinensis]|uniref:S8 family serine peptidase n=1 Tax=Jidongwangia harbinensis TaxID=2878561 RepID=UPI001CD9DC57|nr:S8 family serine peptidase [Jidongwangia harbinensis]MCA2218593.1 S8 family serine peptidase [Jidongwangia harbinensis]